MASLNYINRHLKHYDSCIYATEHKIGRYDIYRKSQFMCQAPHFLFSLTDNWKPEGKSVVYGMDVILDRIKAHDLWRDDSFVENYLKNKEKQDEIKDRDRKNNVEAFLYEFAGKFREATKDINTASMKKLYREENSHGYCEPRLGR